MDCPDPPVMLIKQEHVWYKLQKHTSARPAHPHMRDDLANAHLVLAIICPSAIKKLIHIFTCLCTVVFDARGDHVLYFA